MQDRYYIIAIVVILGICCLGGYVAVSGYLNSNAPTLSFLTPGAPVTPVVVVVSTDTPVATLTRAPASGPTAPPLPSPLGAFQTIAAETTQGPATPTVNKTAAPAAATTQAPTAPAAATCDKFPYCPKGGPPDFALGPTGKECPTNYIWGRVADKNGNGVANVKIRFKLIDTGESDIVVTKGPPDPAGAYNIPVKPGSSWLVWVTDGTNQLSPQVTVTTAGYTGSGDCPTRRDFVQQ
ncbi:MAG: hypothetical protein M1482_01070 [Chloroflexi bacterium]|nr:hypothetical protein [Chloroflexota bacterium]